MSEQSLTTALYAISQTLEQGIALTASLEQALVILVDFLSAIQGIIRILNPIKNEVQIEIIQGQWKEGKGDSLGKAGEKISNRVIDNGQPIIIPKISHEITLFTQSGQGVNSYDSDFSIICVPLIKGRRIVGTITIYGIRETSEQLAENRKILSIVATMITRQATQLEAIRFEKEKRIEETQKFSPEFRNSLNTTIIGNSSKMREVFQMISQVSESNATVLIRGESGTGKEMVASAIHTHSQRVNHPMVKLNCAAIPSNLIESELFGHEKGAFTGAIKQKPGKFEMAHRGSIFLDEIGSIDLSVQVKLLRVLQEKEFERVGGQRPQKTDVRVIAATNRNLEQAVENGEFRGDLYYRLNVFPIYLPPLRERKTDILLLAEYFLEKYSNENKKEIRRLSTPAIDMLMGYHWPGNVRELENCIERAVLLCDQGVIHSYHLPPTLQTGEHSGTVPAISLDDAIANLEREMIIDALKNSSGNISNAAQMLRTTVRKFSYKLKQLGINYRQYRQ